MTDSFPEQIPAFYRQLIDWQHQDTCPLAKMMVKSPLEHNLIAGENADPIGDHVNEVTPGLIHRYPHKVLLILNSTCAGHCRFCFRRASPFTHDEVSLDFSAIAKYLQNHPEVNEFILSGGDPLLVDLGKWHQLKKILLQTPTIEIVRWHSRLPVFNPFALSPTRAQDFFSLPNKKVILVIHLNHDREISPAFITLVQSLQRNFPTLTLKSQSVLLKGVNADVTSLQTFCLHLQQLGIQPYRLYHLDQAPGISHFRLSIAAGLTLYRQLERILPPAALPEYYLDLPQGRGKIPVTSLTTTNQPNQYLAHNHLGESVIYQDLAI